MVSQIWLKGRKTWWIWTVIRCCEYTLWLCSSAASSDNLLIWIIDVYLSWKLWVMTVKQRPELWIRNCFCCELRQHSSQVKSMATVMNQMKPQNPASEQQSRAVYSTSSRSSLVHHLFISYHIPRPSSPSASVSATTVHHSSKYLSHPRTPPSDLSLHTQHFYPDPRKPSHISLLPSCRISKKTAA